MRLSHGVTLLEILLVFLLGTSMFLLSLQAYKQFSISNDLQAVRYNVSLIFNSIDNYYKVACQHGGVLDPSNPAANLATPYVMPASAYVVPYYPSNLLISTIVDNADPKPIIVQFNPWQPTSSTSGVNFSSMTAVGCTDTAVPCTVSTSVIRQTQAPVLVWKLQIAVKLKDPTLAQTYKNALGATCVSSTGAATPNGMSITPCATSTNTGSYLVWEELPSASESGSVLSPSLSELKQFNILYSHDVMYELSLGNSTPKYYLCGG